MSAITQQATAKNETFANQTTSQIIFIRKKEVMRLTGLTSSSLYDLIKRGLFPKQITLSGGKSVVWTLSSVENWQKQCLEHSTSQGAA